FGFWQQLADAVLALFRPYDIDDRRALRFQHLADVEGDALLVRHAEDDDRSACKSKKAHAGFLMFGPSPMSAMPTINSVRSTFWPFTLAAPFMIRAPMISSTISASI